jgi:hypothetical protein
MKCRTEKGVPKKVVPTDDEPAGSEPDSDSDSDSDSDLFDEDIEYSERDYKYSKEQAAPANREFFPFINYTNSLLHMFDVATHPPRRTLEFLWLIITDPNFKAADLVSSPKVLKRMAYRGLPYVPLEQVICIKVINKPHHAKRTQYVAVEYLNMVDLFKRFYADPLSRGALVTHSTPGTETEVVSEFYQTPFAKNLSKYNSLQSFYHKGVEYQIGDFMRQGSVKHSVYRIDKLSYKQVTLTRTTIHILLLLCFFLPALLSSYTTLYSLHCSTRYYT